MSLFAKFEFDHVGVFTYFHEEGTTAYNYEDLISGETAASRRDELMRVQQEISDPPAPKAWVQFISPYFS